MPDAPLITVAIPTCNGARFVAEALDSVLAQHGATFDLLVIDDRSEDDTLDVVRDRVGDLARIEVNPERLGLAGNWNRCVARSRTPWVAVFHQDDVMRPGHLRLHAAIARMNVVDLGMIAGTADVIDEAGGPVPEAVVGHGRLHLPPARLPVASPDPGGPPPFVSLFAAGSFPKELAAGNPVRCSGVTLSRAAHGRLGGFHPEFAYAVDWEFWARLGRMFAVAWVVKPTTVAIRWHTSSETHRFRSGLDDLAEEAALLKQLGREPGVDPSWRRAGRRELARAYLNRAYVAARAGDGPLTRRALAGAVLRSPGVLGRVALDPRLAYRLATGLFRPAPPADEQDAGDLDETEVDESLAEDDEERDDSGPPTIRAR